jgi:hypothetical protein
MATKSIEDHLRLLTAPGPIPPAIVTTAPTTIEEFEKAYLALLANVLDQHRILHALAFALGKQGRIVASDLKSDFLVRAACLTDDGRLPQFADSIAEMIELGGRKRKEERR